MGTFRRVYKSECSTWDISVCQIKQQDTSLSFDFTIFLILESPVKQSFSVFSFQDYVKSITFRNNEAI